MELHFESRKQRFGDGAGRPLQDCGGKAGGWDEISASVSKSILFPVRKKKKKSNIGRRKGT